MGYYCLFIWQPAWLPLYPAPASALFLNVWRQKHAAPASIARMHCTRLKFGETQFGLRQHLP
jgi:hypothetical protein